MTAGGQLTGIQLAPAGAIEPLAPWEPPDYADPSSFEDLEVTLGSGPLAVRGVLSLRGSGLLPAVVLLAGSGSLDRDETVGPNKPFPLLDRRPIDAAAKGQATEPAMPASPKGPLSP